MDLQSPRLEILTIPKMESSPTRTYGNIITCTGTNAYMDILNLKTCYNSSYTIILWEFLIGTSVISKICDRNLKNTVKIYLMTNNNKISYM